MAESEAVTEADVLGVLSRVPDLEFGGDLVSRRRVRNVRICDGNVAFEVMAGGAGASPEHPSNRELVETCRAAVSRLPGVTLVNVRISAPVPQAPAPQAAAPQSPPAPGGAPQPGLLPGVKHVIAVGSGKGGVGKSTVAVNIAVALAQDGARVGLLDADVYGPSIPIMMGVRHPPFVEDGKMLPLEEHGVRLMSLGFLMPDDAAHVIWRGPMVASAIRQMLTDCKWGELDYLLVDLPPGTGDAQLTLAQSVPLTGAVVVMTSQDVAVNIASKAVGMFTKLNVPILGVVGNMDEFVCPHCRMQTPIFTSGGSENAAARLQVPYLGSIPLDPAIVTHGDSGRPTVVTAPDSTQAEAFRQVARTLATRVLAADGDADTPSNDPLGGLMNRFRKS